ncbi:MAG TPA: penicillin acylase family protein [Gammaproteobacteria bacterium]
MKKPLLLLLAVLLAVAGTVAATLTASLPRRDGAAEVRGLSAPVTIELDAHAIPRIRAATLADAFRAQGFVHAQERFFQMDLTRRDAAGELAELFGEIALDRDRERRRFRYRERARALAASLPAEQRAWLAAYVEGVNAGLEDLGSRPPEYWVLRAEPEPWTLEDSLLVVYAFYTMLSENHRYERSQGVMRATLPDDVYAFLTPAMSRFDRPLDAIGSPDPTGGYAPLPVPRAASLEPGAPAPPSGTLVAPPLAAAASNQWAVAAERSASGTAIVANDTHLTLRLPNVFHRAELYWGGRVARGLGIPGVPGILVGATDRIAYGVTVSYADQSDWVVVETADGDRAYRVPEGIEPFRIEREEIVVRGRDEPVVVEVASTRWGPVVARDWLGRPLVLHATWLEPGGVDLDVLRLMLADSVGEAVETLSGWAGPSLSYVLADADGDIGWITTGPLPIRTGFDGSVPESWADGARAWIGYREPPSIVAPESGALFNANNRALGAAKAEALGRAWMAPFRAHRIADLLAARPRFAERDFLAMQLDTRAEAYDIVRDVALRVLDEAEPDPVLAAARQRIADWNGRADATEVGFRLVYVCYRALRERVLAPLLAPVRAADPAFVYRWPLSDEPMRRLLEERPLDWLPEGFDDWDAFLRDVVVDAIQALEHAPAGLGPETAWGDANRLDVGHPFSALPLVGNLFRLPPVPQPGAAVTLRVAEPRRGAVMRMAVSPSAPENGILEMPEGQSGHFLSPHFRDLQKDWVDGAPTPFLAGETVDEYRLLPPRSAD